VFDCSRIKIYLRNIFTMKKYLLFALAAGILITLSCNKGGSNPTNTTTCSYDACQLKAPDSEIVRLEKYLAENSITAVKHCSGLYYMIVTPGTGNSPTFCSDVSVNYVGSYTNGNVFQRSSTPATFNLLGVISGWTKGVPLVKKGGKIKLYLPPSLAYGPNQYQTIPGNSILIFDIDLLDYR
jgi:FKBP-type peptidyl-prolyl cis-trans isomerase FkpA